MLSRIHSLCAFMWMNVHAFCDDIFVDYVTQSLVVILVRKLLATRNHPKFDFKYLTYMYFLNLWISITSITYMRQSLNTHYRLEM